MRYNDGSAFFLFLIHNNIQKNWIIEIKKKLKNYINNFSWFLLHAEKP